MSKNWKWQNTSTDTVPLSPYCIPVTLSLKIKKKKITKDQLIFPLQDFGLS